MVTVGIVAEYNPFHNGHLYQIEKIREKSPDAVIVAVMSGNLVQRGEFAVMDKYTRAAAAVECGVDAVFELPSVYSVGSANIFASAAVYILNALTGVNYLCFGSESGDINRLSETADNLVSDKFADDLRGFLKLFPQNSYASNVALAYSSKFGDAEILRGSNNILAVEYLIALKRLNSKIVPMTVRRIGSNYNSMLADTAASAGFIRSEYRKFGLNSLDRLKCHMPQNSFKFFETALRNGAAPQQSNIESAVLSYISRLTPEEILSHNVSNISRGDAWKIVLLAKKCFTLDQVIQSLKAKHISESAAQRMVYNSFFGISSSAQRSDPPFTVLLAFSEKRGRNFLASIKKSTEIKIITKPADKRAYERDAHFIYEKNIFIDETFIRACDARRNMKSFMHKKPYIFYPM